MLCLLSILSWVIRIILTTILNLTLNLLNIILLYTLFQESLPEGKQSSSAMARQLSTSVSDFILACSVLYAVLNMLHHSQFYSATGLGIQGLAASAGVVRFSMLRSEMGPVYRTHKFLSWLAAAAGPGLISYQFCLKYEAMTTGHLVIAFAGLVTLSAQFMTADNKKLFTEASSGLGTLVVLILSGCYFNYFGILAALIYILSGAVIGSEGQLMGILRIDLLHYGLVVGNLSFLWALT